MFNSNVEDINGLDKEGLPVRVAVIGGGIGGVAFAAFVSNLLRGNPDQRIRIDIYEACATLTEIGAGVGMWLRTWKIMQSYGDELTTSLSRIAPSDRDLSETERLAFAFRMGQGNVNNDQNSPFFELMARFGVLTLHRAGLQASLASHINVDDLVEIHFSKRLSEYNTEVFEGRSIVRMKFEDGSESVSDVLIGADGIHSAVRNSLYKQSGGLSGQPPEPTWTGTIVYRSLIQCSELSQLFPDGHPSSKGPVVYFGKSKHVLTYPIMTPNAKDGNADVVNMVAFCSRLDLEGSEYEGPWMRSVGREVLLNEFRDWNNEITGLLKAVNSVSLWAIHVLPALPQYRTGNVCLLGDAAHAMAPHQGAGGGQAIEDAHVLAHLFTHPSFSAKNISRALEVYDKVRRPIAEEVARRSRLNGMMYELNASYDDRAGGLSREERLLNLARSIEELHDWEWTSRDADILQDGDQQVSLALRLFEGE
ncbi:FAD/NAD(P)-binding domain-containing protein [Schizopora paradoxa]|uniref:FAD/NAD(P)-binding domain-containing protein n=1 Tax=Schizopora paradoxa TaxID=27342 RepID=A0A0H2SDA5_9AGAM|nr:FAD/NAD(P)-binding domain-containing protein [Schizopora paradoxa]